MNFFFVILLSGIIILQVWNLVTLRQMRRQGNSPITDPQYNELKSKQEFMVAVGALLLSAAGYFGFSTWKDSEATIKKEMTQSLDTLRNQIDTSKVKFVKGLADIELTSDRAREISTELEELKQKDVLQESYLVTDLYYRSYEDRDAKPKRLYFKDMKTIKGKRLPRFSRPPKIFMYGSSGLMYTLKTTSEYIDVVSYFHNYYDEKKGYIDLPISILIVAQ